MIPRAVSASLVTFEREIYDYRKNLFLFALRNLIQPFFFVLVIGIGLGSMVKSARPRVIPEFHDSGDTDDVRSAGLLSALQL